MELLTVDELSELLKISRNRLILMARRGEVPAFSIAGRLRFDAGEIEQWVKRRRVKPTDPVRLEV